MTSPINGQVIEVDGNKVGFVESNVTDLNIAQSMMDPLRLIEAYLVDKSAPRNARGGYGNRTDNLFQTNEEIVGVVYLANVGKRAVGTPENQNELELYFNIKDEDGRVLQQVRPVHTYQNRPENTDPMADDYFAERFTVSARLNVSGSYELEFVFIDHTRSDDKNIPVSAPLSVIIE
ncbi:MAG: hypothetical protein ABJH45_22625 [Paracoccaceae bacterium]